MTPPPVAPGPILPSPRRGPYKEPKSPADEPPPEPLTGTKWEREERLHVALVEAREAKWAQEAKEKAAARDRHGGSDNGEKTKGKNRGHNDNRGNSQTQVPGGKAEYTEVKSRFVEVFDDSHSEKEVDHAFERSLNKQTKPPPTSSGQLTYTSKELAEYHAKLPQHPGTRKVIDLGVPSPSQPGTSESADTQGRRQAKLRKPNPYAGTNTMNSVFLCIRRSERLALKSGCDPSAASLCWTTGASLPAVASGKQIITDGGTKLLNIT
ncbi:hypothetical protein K474DRAFT_1672286 [Panus rudis PR-1116 ss-1]|nr:hypothetical protein K474DRAFT_1672286 [Panus rudis PR-1116 ss-1]